MGHSSLVCFLSVLCSDLQAALSVGSWCRTARCMGSAAALGALGATWRSVLPPDVGIRCVWTFGQPSAWCRAGGHCHPSGVQRLAGQLPARACFLLTMTFLSQC